MLCKVMEDEWEIRSVGETKSLNPAIDELIQFLHIKPSKIHLKTEEMTGFPSISTHLGTAFTLLSHLTHLSDLPSLPLIPNFDMDELISDITESIRLRCGMSAGEIKEVIEEGKRVFAQRYLEVTPNCRSVSTKDSPESGVETGNGYSDATTTPSSLLLSPKADSTGPAPSWPFDPPSNRITDYDRSHCTVEDTSRSHPELLYIEYSHFSPRNVPLALGTEPQDTQIVTPRFGLQQSISSLVSIPLNSPEKEEIAAENTMGVVYMEPKPQTVPVSRVATRSENYCATRETKAAACASCLLM